METISSSLVDFEVNSKGKIVTITPGSKVRRRLMDMGITKGTEFKIEGKAPFGDPIQISLRGYSLTLRKSEAMDILAERI